MVLINWLLFTVGARSKTKGGFTADALERAGCTAWRDVPALGCAAGCGMLRGYFRCIRRGLLAGGARRRLAPRSSCSPPCSCGPCPPRCRRQTPFPSILNPTFARRCNRRKGGGRRNHGQLILRILGVRQVKQALAARDPR